MAKGDAREWLAALMGLEAGDLTVRSTDRYGPDETQVRYERGGLAVARLTVKGPVREMLEKEGEGLWVIKASKRKTTGWRDDEGNYTDTFFVQQTDNPQRPAWLPVTHGEAERMIATQPLTIPITKIGHFLTEPQLWLREGNSRTALPRLGFEHGRFDGR